MTVALHSLGSAFSFTAKSSVSVQTLATQFSMLLLREAGAQLYGVSLGGLLTSGPQFHILYVGVGESFCDLSACHLLGSLGMGVGCKQVQKPLQQLILHLHPRNTVGNVLLQILWPHTVQSPALY